MKKKLLLFTGIVIVFIPGVYLNAALVDLYNTGTITLKAAPGFGAGTDWESLFYQNARDIAAAPDGTLFVANSRKHTIYRFSKNGKFLGAFGQKGRGPGDLYHPGNLSILDGKYLVVGEYATNRKISLFDFKGKCVKVIKTNHSAFRPVALRDNIIAYIRRKTHDLDSSSPTAEIFIIFKDIGTGKEKTVTSFRIIDKSWVKMPNSKAVIRMPNYVGQVTVTPAPDGNLWAGASNTPVITLYSPNGKPLKTLKLDFPPTPVTGDYVDRFRKHDINELQADAENNRTLRAMLKRLKRFDYSTLFGKHLPYYRKLIADHQGNLLVFRWTGCLGGCQPVFRVYAPDGAGFRFAAETKIDPGAFDVDIDDGKQNLIFTKNGIFGLFQEKDNDDSFKRIVKVDIGGN